MQRNARVTAAGAAAERITVLCVDDHRIVREGLLMIIRSPSRTMR